MLNAEKLLNFKRNIKIPTKYDLENNKGLWLLMGLATLALFTVILFWVIGSKKPATYDEILAQMDDAFLFEQEAVAPLDAFEEDLLTLSETEQLRLLKQGYNKAADVQQLILNDINYMDDYVAINGGISSYEDLQRVKTLPVQNELIAENIEQDLKTFGVKRTRKQEATPDEIQRALDMVYTFEAAESSEAAPVAGE